MEFGHDANMNNVVRIENGKILKEIFSHLRMQDLLTCRLTCHFWNEVICSSAHEEDMFWSKTCLRVKQPPIQKKLKPFTSVDATGNVKTMEWNLWKAIHWSALLYHYKCPNFHVEEMDLRREPPQEFFSTYGHQILHLEITNCSLSLVTYQRIVSLCPNLVYLKIKPVSYHSLICCESLSLMQSAIGKPRAGIWFQRLTTLILHSDYKKHFYMDCTNAHVNNMSPDNIFALDYLENHLHPTVIDEIIHASPYLSEVILYGWTGDTMTNVLKSLSTSSSQDRKITKLEFHDILLMFDIDEFETNLIAVLDQLRLVSFALTFLNPLSLYDTLTCRLNSIVGRVLVKCSKTLTSINLKNCSSVDESIFQPPLRHDYEMNKSGKTTDKKFRFSKLEKLELAGTNVRRLSKFVCLMPKLNQLNFKARKHEDDPIDDVCQTESMCDSNPTFSSISLQRIHETGQKFMKSMNAFVKKKPRTESRTGEEDQLGFLTHILLITLVLYCGYYPFFVAEFGEPWACLSTLAMSTVVFFAYQLEQKCGEYANEIENENE